MQASNWYHGYQSSGCQLKLTAFCFKGLVTQALEETLAQVCTWAFRWFPVWGTGLVEVTGRTYRLPLALPPPGSLQYKFLLFWGWSILPSPSPMSWWQPHLRVTPFQEDTCSACGPSQRASPHCTFLSPFTTFTLHLPLGSALPKLLFHLSKMCSCPD